MSGLHLRDSASCEGVRSASVVTKSLSLQKCAVVAQPDSEQAVYLEMKLKYFPYLADYSKAFSARSVKYQLSQGISSSTTDFMAKWFPAYQPEGSRDIASIHSDSNICLGNTKKRPRVCLSISSIYKCICTKSCSPSHPPCGFG